MLILKSMKLIYHHKNLVYLLLLGMTLFAKVETLAKSNLSSSLKDTTKQIISRTTPTGSMVFGGLVEAEEVPGNPFFSTPVFPSQRQLPSTFPNTGPIGVIKNPNEWTISRLVETRIPEKVPVRIVNPNGIVPGPSVPIVHQDMNREFIHTGSIASYDPEPFVRVQNEHSSSDYYKYENPFPRKNDNQSQMIDQIMDVRNQNPTNKKNLAEPRILTRKPPVQAQAQAQAQADSPTKNITPEHLPPKMSPSLPHPKIPIRPKKINQVDQELVKEEVIDNIVSVEPAKKILRVHSHELHNERSNFPKETQQNVKQLLAWAKGEKITINNKLAIKQHGSNVSVTAKEKIMKNDGLVTIPKDYVISKNHLDLKSICQDIRNISSLKEKFDKICMTVYLLGQNHASLDPFVTFLHQENFFTSPFFYSKKERKLLTGSVFLSLINSRQESMTEEFNTLVKEGILENSQKENYFKDRLNVMSKHFMIQNNGEELSVLVPFAYYFQEGEDGQANFNAMLQLGNNGELTVKAMKNINEGDPIAINVGGINNYQNLLYFGKLKQGNQNPLEIDLEMKINQNSEYKSYVAEIKLTSEMKINSVLKNCRKIAYALTKGMGNNANKINFPSSITNEKEALNILKLGLKAKLENYPTTIQDDFSHLQKMRDKKVLNINQENILSILINEKMIITKFYNSALVFLLIFKKEEKLSEASVEKISPKYLKIIGRNKYMMKYFRILQKHLKLKQNFWGSSDIIEEDDLSISVNNEDQLVGDEVSGINELAYETNILNEEREEESFLAVPGGGRNEPVLESPESTKKPMIIDNSDI